MARSRGSVVGYERPLRSLRRHQVITIRHGFQRVAGDEGKMEQLSHSRGGWPDQGSCWIAGVACGVSCRWMLTRRPASWATSRRQRPANC